MVDHEDAAAPVRGDAPKASIESDEFGLEKIVSTLAETLTHRNIPDGYVLGIQGAWGSGKSTLVNFVAEHVSRHAPYHQIIRFDPWLIGDRGAFLSSFLGQLAAAIESIRRPHLRWWHLDYWHFARMRRRLADKVRRYGEYAAALAVPLGSVAAADATGATALAAVGLKTAGGLAKLFGNRGQSLDKLKVEIFHQLRKLQTSLPENRIVVIVDDTDRLEPHEAAEVLRLVRKAADFPLVTYVICFDEKVLAHQVKTALSVSDGRLYIEKIFQNVVSVPPQEPFALRRYLRRILVQDLPFEMGSLAKMAGDIDTGETNYREHIVLDVWSGRFLITPRDVVRLVQAIEFGWQGIRDKADFLDHVWLQLIKLKVPDLYDWILEYLTNIGAYRDGGRPGDSEPIRLTAKLKEILDKLEWADRAYLLGLGEILPGTETLLMRMEHEEQKVFEFKNNELATFESGKRLGSPSHWRQYFAFDLPTYVLPDEYISSFRATVADDPTSGATLLRELIARPHARKGHFVDLLLDRLQDLKEGSLSLEEKSGLAAVLAETMDEIAVETVDLQDFGRSQIWDKATRLLKRTNSREFPEIVLVGESINWLAGVVRDQAGAHGMPNDERENAARQWLTKDELSEAITNIIDRFKEAGAADIFNRPSPLDILFCWSQLGDADEVRKFVEAAVRESDQMFLSCMKAMQGWSSSNLGIRHPLKRRYVEVFLDPDTAKTRLEMIAGSVNYPEPNRSSAKELLQEWVGDE